MITVIHTTPLHQLEVALDRVVARDPGLASARALLLHPLRLLMALGYDADAVLDDDGFAIERTRLLLAQAAVSIRELLEVLESPMKYSGELALAHYEPSDGDQPENDDNGEEGDDVIEFRRKLCPCGLLDLSGLVIVGLAAARVGVRTTPRAKYAAGFVSTVESLAIAALLADSLAQALSDGFTDDQLTALLGGVRGNEIPQMSALAPLFFDNVERTRFQAIRVLFTKVRSAAFMIWDSTFDTHIVSVERVDANKIKIELDVEGDNERTNDLLERLEGAKATAKFVFWTTEGQVVELPASEISKAHNFAEVSLPAKARSGWLGIATDEAKADARKSRRDLQSVWKKIDNDPPLRAHSIPVNLIAVPKKGKALPPPRSAVACWGISIGDVALTQPEREQLLDGMPAQLSVLVDNSPDPGRLELELVGGGGERLEEPKVGKGRVTFAVPGEWIRSGNELQLRLYVGSSTAPDDQRTIRVSTVTPELSRPIVVVPFEFIGEAVEPTDRQLSNERIQNLIARAQQRHPKLEFASLPVLLDEDRQIDGDPRDLSPTAIDAMLGRLARLAGKTLGLENVQLLALIPGKERMSRREPAEAAACVGVATEASADELLRPLEPAAESRPSRKRLRLIGRISNKGVELTEPVRTFQQGAGPGGPNPSGYEVVLYDAEQTEIGQVRLATHAKNGVGEFVVLLELPEAARRIEFGPVGARKPRLAVSSGTPLFAAGLNMGALLGARVAAVPSFIPTHVSLERPAGQIWFTLHETELPDLTWSFQHSQGAGGTIEIEISYGQTGIWSRIEKLQTDQGSFEMPKSLVQLKSTFVRVIASDGWSTVYGEGYIEQSVEPEQPEPDPVIVSRLEVTTTGAKP